VAPPEAVKVPVGAMQVSASDAGAIVAVGGFGQSNNPSGRPLAVGAAFPYMSRPANALPATGTCLWPKKTLGPTLSAMGSHDKENCPASTFPKANGRPARFSKPCPINNETTEQQTEIINNFFPI
jgi:hypothetical protein